MHDSVKAIRYTTSMLAGFGSGTIAAQFIKNNVHPTGKITAITIPVAAFFIGGALGNAASKNAEETIDSIDAVVTEVRNEIRKSRI